MAKKNNLLLWVIGIIVLIVILPKMGLFSSFTDVLVGLGVTLGIASLFTGANTPFFGIPIWGWIVLVFLLVILMGRRR